MGKEEIISNIIDGSPNRTKESFFKKHHDVVYNDIIDFTSNISDVKFPFKIWHWINNKPNYILCYCGNRLSTNMKWQDGYKKFCSNKCSANSDYIKTKTKITLLEKYGVDHYSKTDEYVEKYKKTCIDRYGVDNYSKTDEYVKKSKQTCIDRYGVDNYMKTVDFIEKYRKTNLEKYNKNHIFENDNYRFNNFQIANDENYIKYLKDSISLFKCDSGENHTFEISTDNYYGRKKIKSNLCTVCYPISDNASLKEIHLKDYISSLVGKNISNYRDKYEIDIYLPDLKLGFEFNGLYWHSDKFKEKNYHINKTNYFKEKGIKIIHIWEDDWSGKQDIVKSQIKNWLGVTESKIFGRKCVVKEITKSKISSKFLNDNHIQGTDRSKIKIGLYYENELVSLMTFNKNEGRKKMTDGEWNLSRYCNKLNTSVIGGASKLLKYFERNYDVKRIISYADKDWSTGGLYYNLGFKLESETKPDYKYIINNRRIHKSRYRKSRLKTTLTESQEMKKSHINKIWDCGKLKFQYLFN